jgi:hypothetical protein
MRDRHISRLCRSCQGPMARQEDACWRCGARWAAEEPPSTRLRIIDGTTGPLRDDAGRWSNEGGSVDGEAGAARAVGSATP